MFGPFPSKPCIPLPATHTPDPSLTTDAAAATMNKTSGIAARSHLPPETPVPSSCLGRVVVVVAEEEVEMIEVMVREIEE